MIVLRLRGGLGNQLFQYAAGKSLALHHRVPLKLDTYYYTHHPYRTLALDSFRTDYQQANESEIASFVGKARLEKLFHKKTNYRYCRRAFGQPYYHFYPDFYQLPNHVYLSGYWQSERYFRPHASVIRKHFIPRAAPSEQNAHLIDEMRRTESVSLHVRHGDYAQVSSSSHFFTTLDIDYYRSAIQWMQERVGSPRFFLFSDNIDWCRATFTDLNDAVFVDHNQGEDSYWDLWLMAQCRHHIMANSSFSWWGAWLGEHPNKLVVAPRQWFKANRYQGRSPVYPERTYHLQDQLPDEWIRL